MKTSTEVDNDIPGDASALIVLAHPERRSFNGQLADRCAATSEEEGLNASVLDLYSEGFDPVEKAGHYLRRHDPGYFRPMIEQRFASAQGCFPRDVTGAIRALHESDLVVFQFPLWWYGPPAILKGWFDRVFAYGEMYSSTRRYDRGVLRGRNALLSVTTGSPREVFRLGRDGDIAHYLWPVQFTLYYLGFTVWPPHVIYGIKGDAPFVSPSADYRHLVEASESLSSHVRRVIRSDGLTPVDFNGWEDWDEAGRLLPTSKIRFPFRSVS